jgi:hypothetical protein
MFSWGRKLNESYDDAKQTYRSPLGIKEKWEDFKGSGDWLLDTFATQTLGRLDPRGVANDYDIDYKKILKERSEEDARHGYWSHYSNNSPPEAVQMRRKRQDERYKNVHYVCEQHEGKPIRFDDDCWSTCCSSCTIL